MKYTSFILSTLAGLLFLASNTTGLTASLPVDPDQMPVLIEKRTVNPSPDEVKERMQKNLPAIDKLKKSGKIGETFMGYLRPREELSESETNLVKVENADRKYIYELLAERAGTTSEKIAETRAKQIRERSAPSLWFFTREKEWEQKQ